MFNTLQEAWDLTLIMNYGERYPKDTQKNLCELVSPAALEDGRPPKRLSKYQLCRSEVLACAQSLALALHIVVIPEIIPGDMTQISSLFTRSAIKTRGFSLDPRFHFLLCTSVVMTAYEDIPKCSRSLPSVTAGHSRFLPPSNNMEGSSVGDSWLALGVSILMVSWRDWWPVLGGFRCLGHVSRWCSGHYEWDSSSVTAGCAAFACLIHACHGWLPPPGLTGDSPTPQTDPTFKVSVTVNISLRRRRQNPLSKRRRTDNCTLQVYFLQGQHG